MTNINRDILVALRVIKAMPKKFEGYDKLMFGNCGRVILGTSGAVPFKKMRAYAIALGPDYEKVLRGSATKVSTILTEARSIALALDVVESGLGEVTVYENNTSQGSRTWSLEEVAINCVLTVLDFARDRLENEQIRQCIYEAGEDSVFYELFQHAKMMEPDICKNVSASSEAWGNW